MWLRSSFILMAVLLSHGCKSGGKIRYGKNQGTHISISYLKSRYELSPVAISEEIYITGRITSTDQYGNFYKTLIVEDQSGGIAVRINMENYHRIYYRGMQVKISCNSLVLSSYGGTLQLGEFSYDEQLQRIGYISYDRLHAVIGIEKNKDEENLPLSIDISELSPVHISRFVSIKDVQFAEDQYMDSWCDSESITGTDRHIIDKIGNLLIVRNSPYVNFANILLPQGSGFIEGVISYFNGKYQLEICSHTHAVMHNPRF